MKTILSGEINRNILNGNISKNTLKLLPNLTIISGYDGRIYKESIPPVVSDNYIFQNGDNYIFQNEDNYIFN